MDILFSLNALYALISAGFFFLSLSATVKGAALGPVFMLTCALFASFFIANSVCVFKASKNKDYRATPYARRLLTILNMATYAACMFFLFETQNRMGLYTGCCTDSSTPAFFRIQSVGAVILSIQCLANTYYVLGCAAWCGSTNRKIALLLVVLIYLALVAVSAYGTYPYASGEKCVMRMDGTCGDIW